MAVGTGYSKVASSGLVFAYDTGDTYNSYLGRPTTNVLANAGMSTYNNVPGNVSSNLYSTSETYRGATVWRQDLTAADGSGAYYLSNGNNPGIGVVTGGGGGSANTYTGHSIFFKPTVPMNGNPIYTNYSNIGGWQSGNLYENMGDGWFRAYVLWYDTVSRSDGKYWAINPLSTAIGQTVTIYWAGPFREDLNSTSISQFVNGTRSSTQGLIDLSGKGTSLNLSSISYTNVAINPQTYFDGTDDQINMDSNASVVPTSNLITVEAVVKPLAFSSNRVFMAYGGNNNDRGFLLQFENGSGLGFIVFNTPASGPAYLGLAASQQYLNQYVHMVGTYDGSKVRYYLNGAQVALANYTSGLPAQTTFRIGNEFNRSYYANAYIPVSKVYDRVLSETEIKQNYDHYKTRFSLPTETYRYYEGANAAPFISNWNNSTTYTMADFGGIPNVTAHGWSSGPATYTLTLNNLPPHTKVRYRVYWHLVDSLDNETNQLFIMNSSGTETEILRFTKQYNLVPAISVLDSNTSAKWSGGQTYTYRPWAGGAYGQDGYLIVDSGLQNHTANSFTARHVLGADQAQADEAEYLSHVEVLLY